MPVPSKEARAPRKSTGACIGTLDEIRDDHALARGRPVFAAREAGKESKGSEPEDCGAVEACFWPGDGTKKCKIGWLLNVFYRGQPPLGAEIAELLLVAPEFGSSL